VPQVEGMLAEAARARAAGADVVIASVHCCTEYESDPGPTQTAIAGTLLASPDVDLVLGHHAHVVQPFERINGKGVVYGLGNHIAEQDLPVTYDSVIARFTFTRDPDGHYVVTTAEAIPTRIAPQGRSGRHSHPSRRSRLPTGRRSGHPPRRRRHRPGRHRPLNNR
jgi:poly-gamma-glutamate capsule biosynthesis protein CapA/YwtB (metallophosphatase superfamily)